MFTQTTPKTESIVITENINYEPENIYFSKQLSPKSPNEAFKDGQTVEVIQEISKVFRDENSTVDSCVSDSMKLLIESEEPENGQGHVLSSSPTTEGTLAMTANNHLAPSDDDVGILSHQTGISDKYSLNANMNIFNIQVELSCSCKTSLVNYTLEKIHIKVIYIAYKQAYLFLLFFSKGLQSL